MRFWEPTRVHLVFGSTPAGNPSHFPLRPSLPRSRRVIRSQSFSKIDWFAFVSFLRGVTGAPL
jgi:hypothetical protein